MEAPRAILTASLAAASGMVAPAQAWENPSAMTEPDRSPAHVHECMRDARQSYASSSFRYAINSDGSPNLSRVIHEVEGRAMPDECAGVVARAFRVRIDQGNKGHIRPNSAWLSVSLNNEAFNASVSENTWRAYKCGKFVVQEVQVQRWPVNADGSFGQVKPWTFRSKAVAVNC